MTDIEEQFFECFGIEPKPINVEVLIGINERSRKDEEDRKMKKSRLFKINGVIE